MPDAALTDDETDAYLRRIGADRPRRPDLSALTELHRRHLLAVPFENLDIHTGGRNELDRAAVFAKVVDRRRGGWCFELNSLFAALLGAIGFEVELLAARVARDDGTFGQPFEHLALRVRLEGEPAPLLADVGFGEAFMKPVPMVADRLHDDGEHSVRLVDGIDGWVYEDDRDGSWRPRYTFAGRSHPLDAFRPMSDWLQTSPESHFTQQQICSLATERGRVTLSNDRLIVRVDGQRTEETVKTVDDRILVLHERFGVAVPPPV